MEGGSASLAVVRKACLLLVTVLMLYKTKKIFSECLVLA